MPDTQSNFVNGTAAIANSPVELARQSFAAMGLAAPFTSDQGLPAVTPVDGSLLGMVPADTPASTDAAIARAREAFLEWRCVPAPRRGELIRRFGNLCRDYK